MYLSDVPFKFNLTRVRYAEGAAAGVASGAVKSWRDLKRWFADDEDAGGQRSRQGGSGLFTPATITRLDSSVLSRSSPIKITYFPWSSLKLRAKTCCVKRRPWKCFVYRYTM